MGEGAYSLFCGSGLKGDRKPPTLKLPLGGLSKTLLLFEAYSSGPFCSTGYGLIRVPIMLSEPLS